MSAIAAPKLMTTEQLLALPDKDTERWLIYGQLREKPMTKRNRWHSRVLIRLGFFLELWLEKQPEPRGSILGGEVGCRLRRDPDVTVGVDLVYVGPELAAQEPDNTRLIEGVPILAVEILSPNDTTDEIDEKIEVYLATGVALVWIVNPRSRTVTVYRQGAEPELFNATHTLTAEPHLPGFSVPVAHIFTK